MRPINRPLPVRCLFLGICLGPLFGWQGQVCAGVVIDTFATPGDGTAFYAPGHPSMGPGYPSNPYFRQDSGDGILGGQGTRQLRLEVVGDPPIPFNAAVGWMPQGELHVATFGEGGARLDLTYTPDSAEIDLTEGGANSMFIISFSSLDPGFGDFLRLVTTIANADGTEVVHVMDLPSSTTTTAYELLFRDFAFADLVAHPAGDPRDILREAANLRFTFNAHDVPYANIDFGLLGILAVPEPSAILLGGSGLLTLMLLGPRRRMRRMSRHRPVRLG